ncbi:gamma-tubulin complex component protein [Chlamydoabsidia padenii]|nr:gamma-tubulin complex component protein [Chlamydoabsidia padenii]
MFHEILFVLFGYPGDVFKTPEDNNATFAIVDNFPLLHPTERQVLNRLGQLGWMYHQLDLFITNTLQPKATTINVEIYQQALATGLAHILSDYRSLLLSLEKRWVTKQDHVMDLPGGMVPLCFVTSALGRWELIIPSLLHLVNKINNQSTVLSQVMDQLNTGIPELQGAMVYLVEQLSNVFYRQVTAWMIYGRLPSQPCFDFFITPKQQQQRQEQQQQQQSTDHTEWQRHFTLHWDRVPTQILANNVAASVFYVGKVVATLQTKKTLSADRFGMGERLVMPAAMKKHHLDLLKSLQPNMISQSSSSSSSPPPPTDSTLPPLVSPSTSSDSSSSPLATNTCIQSTTTLPISITQRHHFEHIVHQIRRSTTTWLFSKVFQQEHDLINYFSSFRQLFLLGDGELAIRWLEALDRLTSSSSSDTSFSPLSLEGLNPQKQRHTTDLSQQKPDDLWQQQKREWDRLLIKASIGTDSENCLDGYAFDFDNNTTTTNGSFISLFNKKDGNGRLAFKLQWPIDLFLGESDMQQYSDLWTFLMGLKKVQMTLTHVLPLLNEDRQLWRLRSHMLFWVDTLWSHVQGNVIKRHYDQLMTACDHPLNSTDFDKVQNVHDDYLMYLTRGCLLSSTDCRHSLLELLHTCLDFCDLVQRQGHHQQEPSPYSSSSSSSSLKSEMDPISSLEKTFVIESDHLFGLLSSQYHEMKRNDHLHELLMCLDYNKWYSTCRYKEIGDLAA